jgi:hypothetical protein
MNLKYSIINKARRSKFPIKMILYIVLIATLTLSSLFILCAIITSAVTMLSFKGKN